MSIDHSRINDLADPSAFIGKSVGFIGMGRAGVASLTSALTLPISGVFAVDNDIVDEKDALLFGAGSAGMKKVHAAGSLVRFFRPDILYTPIDARITSKNMKIFRELIRRIDLLVWAADDWTSLCDLIGEIHGQVLAVAISNSENGSYIEVAWSDFSQMPCIKCSLQAERKESASGVGSLAIDTSLGGNLVTRIAAGLLLRNSQSRGQELFEPYLNRRSPLLVLSSRPTRFARSSNSSVPQLVRQIPVTRRCEICAPNRRF